jgi:hypothetical protein
MDEREHLPLRRVPEHSGGDQRRQEEDSRMNPFTYSRSADLDEALTAVSGKAQKKIERALNDVTALG